MRPNADLNRHRIQETPVLYVSIEQTRIYCN